MSKEETSSSKAWVAIITAIIGAIGAITVAYFTYRGIVTPKELEISATQTAENMRATQTAAMSVAVSTNTLIPAITQSPLPIHETPLSNPISGFENNCINSNIWTPYTKVTSFSKNGNCWDMVNRGISASDNQLLFAVNNSSEQSGSIYTPLPNSGNVSFSINIEQLKIGEPYGDIVFGLGNSSGWLQSGKFIFLRITKPDAPIYIVYGTDVTRSGERVFDSYDTGTLLNFSFDINGLVLNIYANDDILVDTILLSDLDKQVFWIGYRLPRNSTLLAYISNFSVVEK